MIHDLLKIKLKLIKCTPKIVSKSVILDVPVSSGVQISKGANTNHSTKDLSQVTSSLIKSLYLLTP